MSKLPPSTATATSAAPAAPPPGLGRGARRIGPVTTIIVAALTVGMIGAMLFVEMDRGITGLLIMLVTVGLLLLGMPIAIAMFAATVIGLWKLGGMRMVTATFQETIYSGAANWQLSVIPLFVFMGIVLWRSGLTTGMFESARMWLGRLPGGLAVGTNFAGAGLAASSGSSIGISYALGRVAIPEMIKAGYAPSLATGVVTMAGTLGQLIPPSIMLVIYAGIAQTSVGPQLLAAIVPGIIIAFAFGLMIIVRAALNPRLAPRFDTSDITWRGRFTSLLKVLPVALVIFVVIGGLLGGVFTATEAGAFGALIAIIAGWLFGSPQHRSPRGLARLIWTCLKDAVVATAGIFLLLISVGVLSRAMALTQLATDLSEGVAALGLDRVSLLLILMVVYVLLGLFLEPLAMMLLTLPVLVAPLAAVGVDMVWFGVFLVVMVEIAVVSPPVGMLAFIVYRLAQDKDVNLGTKITLTDVFKGVTWFVVVALLIVLLLIFFPDIVMWLPSLGGA